MILVDSELNDDNIRNRDMEDDEDNTDPTECMILGKPPENFKKIKLYKMFRIPKF